jgi:hypothetical protein
MLTSGRTGRQIGLNGIARIEGSRGVESPRGVIPRISLGENTDSLGDVLQVLAVIIVLILKVVDDRDTKLTSILVSKSHDLVNDNVADGKRAEGLKGHLDVTSTREDNGLLDNVVSNPQMVRDRDLAGPQRLGLRVRDASAQEGLPASLRSSAEHDEVAGLLVAVLRSQRVAKSRSQNGLNSVTQDTARIDRATKSQQLSNGLQNRGLLWLITVQGEDGILSASRSMLDVGGKNRVGAHFHEHGTRAESLNDTGHGFAETNRLLDVAPHVRGRELLTIVEETGLNSGVERDVGSVSLSQESGKELQGLLSNRVHYWGVVGRVDLQNTVPDVGLLTLGGKGSNGFVSSTDSDGINAVIGSNPNLTGGIVLDGLLLSVQPLKNLLLTAAESNHGTAAVELLEELSTMEGSLNDLLA